MRNGRKPRLIPIDDAWQHTHAQNVSCAASSHVSTRGQLSASRQRLRFGNKASGRAAIRAKAGTLLPYPKPPTETRQQSTKTVSTGACTPATETAEVSQCAWCRQPCTSSQLYVRTVPEAGQQRKVRLCPQCISCSQCGARLQGMKHSSRGGDNRCLKCCKANREDHNRLQQLWKLSRRKQCQCKKPVHTETCPMAPRQFGERPFPGCDVMTLAEYQQLQLQRKRLKAAKLQ